LDPGRTVTGTVLGPDGKPLAGARVSGLKDMVYWDGDPLPGADFTATGLTEDQPRLLQFVHEGQRLAGSVVVRAGEAGPVRVRLEPWGTLSGRLVTPDGEPMTDVEVYSSGAKDDSLDAGTFPRPVRPDKGGKFRAEGLVPGLKYSLSVSRRGYGLEISGEKPKDLTLRAGETKDLGDIRVKPME
jgi:hypothetical protein